MLLILSNFVKWCIHKHPSITVPGTKGMDGSGFGNPERGWNDPPKLAFSTAGRGNTAGPGRHRLLNKRVPIPLNPQDTSSSSPMPPTLKGSSVPPTKSGIPLHPPPVSTCPPPASLPPAAATQCDGELRHSNHVPSQEMLELVETKLLDCLKAISEKIKESTHEEIRKRLNVMAEMWQKDQLSLEVQKRMVALSEALSQQDHKKAWALHQGLIVDYTTTCSPWMVGVKTLISESLAYSEDKLKEDELPDSSTKNFEVKPNADLDDKREEFSSSVSSVAMEK